MFAKDLYHIVSFQDLILSGAVKDPILQIERSLYGYQWIQEIKLYDAGMCSTKITTVPVFAGIYEIISVRHRSRSTRRQA
jgi:hypothetical protein